MGGKKIVLVLFLTMVFARFVSADGCCFLDYTVYSLGCYDGGTQAECALDLGEFFDGMDCGSVDKCWAVCCCNAFPSQPFYPIRKGTCEETFIGLPLYIVEAECDDTCSRVTPSTPLCNASCEPNTKDCVGRGRIVDIDVEGRYYCWENNKTYSNQFLCTAPVADGGCPTIEQCTLGGEITSDCYCGGILYSSGFCCSDNRYTSDPSGSDCSFSSCYDGIKNYDETDIDCGGSCPKCENGKQCLFDSDCQGNYCNEGICETYHCKNGIKDNDETDIDCGGSCLPCPTCDDGIKNGLEEGIDCGGSCHYSCEAPLILVHGFLSQPSTWKSLEDYLVNQGYNVYKYNYSPAIGDIRVYGANLKHFVDNVKDETKAKKVDIIAHSMGGLVSRWYLKWYSDDVRKFIILGTPNRGTSRFNNLKLLMYTMMYLFDIGDPLSDMKWLEENIAASIARKQMQPCSEFLNMLNYNGMHPDYPDCFIEPEDRISGVEIYTLAGYKGSLLWQIEVGLNDYLVSVKSVHLDNALSNNYTYLTHPELRTNNVVFEWINSILSDSSKQVQSLYITKIKEDSSNPVKSFDIEQFDGGDKNNYQELPVIDGYIHLGENKVYTTNVHSTTRIEFAVGFLSGDINLTLSTPNGSLINPEYCLSDNKTSFNRIGNLKSYTIYKPLEGDWELRVNAVNISVDGTNFTIFTFLETNITLNSLTRKLHYKPNDKPNITVSLNSSNGPIIGSEVIARIKLPDDSTDNIKLYDDGLHNDKLVQDGIYGNIYTNTTSLGIYELTINASGIFNDNHFEREIRAAFWVELYPDLIVKNISFSNPVPIEGESITISALIENIGEKEALNATIEFYHSTKYEDELIGEVNISVGISEEVMTSIDWTNLSVGDYNVTVLISPFNSFIEGDYSNNIANKSISVKAKLLSSLNLPLTKGWNLISIPLNLTNNTLPEPFKSIEGNYTCAYAYNSTWNSYCSGDPSGSNKYLTPTKGFWIYMINDDILNVEGYTIYNMTSNLSTNWDLMGYLYLEERNISELLDNVTVYAYNNSKWYSYNSNKPSYLNTLNRFTPGYGYWIKIENNNV